MAWLNWFTGKNNKALANARAPHSDVLSSQQLDSTRPMSGARLPGHTSQPAATASAQRLEQRRTERNAKRELLFQVVREAMVRVGVLSSAFKFKVLSLDQRGRSFLVMIELSAEFSGEVEKLAEIESMIAQTARHRFEIIVQAVYWRYFNSASPSSTPSNTPASAPAPLLGAMHAPISRPAPLFGIEGSAASLPVTKPSPLPSSIHAPTMQPLAHAAIRPSQQVAAVEDTFPLIVPTASPKSAATLSKSESESDDLSDDEVAAFRRALAAGAAQGAMAAPPEAVTPAVAAVKPPLAPKPAAPSTLDKARSKLLLTGYEDTEMHDDDPMPALSGTQYGELR